METKTFTAKVELKEDGLPGEFKAVFATLNVRDHHNDLTIPGAFTDGQEAVVEQWNHGYELPTGKGVIRSNDTEAWVEGQFFLDTQQGKDHYNTVKNLGNLAEWSYTFDIIKSTWVDPEENDGVDRILQNLDVVGFAPVTRGAGIGTRTIDIKGKNKQESQESEATDDQTGNSESSDGLKTSINIIEGSLILLERTLKDA